MARKKHTSPQRITAHYMYGEQDFEHFVGEGLQDTFTKFLDGVDAHKVSSVTLDLHIKDHTDIDRLKKDITNLKAVIDD